MEEERKSKLSNEAVQDLTARLRRIGGQIQGLERMLIEGRQCSEVLVQMTAVLRALKACASVLAMETMTAQCHCSVSEDTKVEELLDCLQPLLDQLAKL